MTVHGISRDRITSVYHGKAGECACGCAGRHSTHKGTITRMFNRLRRNQIVVRKGDGHLWTEINGRLWIAYYE